MRDKTITCLVAIVGGSGAGKSWLAARLKQLLAEKTTRLSQDDFYLDRSHLPPSRRERINFDHPNAIDWPLLEQVLHSCRTGHVIHVPRYDFTTHTRLQEFSVLSPKPLILIDGLWLLHRPSIRRMFDLSIFIDCPERLRLRRRLARDTIERGRDRTQVRRQFQRTVAPMHRRFVQPQIHWATLALRQPFQESDVQRLADHFWVLLKAGALLPAWMRETFRAELQALIKKHQPDHD